MTRTVAWRIAKVQRLLDAEYECDGAVNRSTALCDVLSDLRHFAAAHGLDWNAELATSAMHFTEEASHPNEEY